MPEPGSVQRATSMHLDPGAAEESSSGAELSALDGPREYQDRRPSFPDFARPEARDLGTATAVCEGHGERRFFSERAR